MKWYLDFGHGGKDSGALGSNKTKESDIVLRIGMIVKKNLEEAFEKVITTRNDDTYYSLDYRNSKANKENCDYFVSIHMNSSTNKSAKGCEAWVYDEKSKLYPLAKDICSNLSKTLDTYNRSVKISKEFSVLRKTNMPAMIIEVDFISNSIVEDSCNSDKYIKDAANSISYTLLASVNKSIIDDGVFYRVCVGAFNNKSNAVKIKNEAIAKGFKDTYIIYLYKKPINNLTGFL